MLQSARVTCGWDAAVRGTPNAAGGPVSSAMLRAESLLPEPAVPGGVTPRSSSHAPDPRLDRLRQWLAVLGYPADDLRPASGDASFRRYFRLRYPGGTLIAMDAPPQQEDCRPFLAVRSLLEEAGVTVPAVLARDLEAGYLLLSDLGDRRYLDVLDPPAAARLYAAALDSLARAQKGIGGTALAGLPPYDRALLEREMAFFSDWLVAGYLGLRLSPAERQVLGRSFDALAEAALEQPRVFVHRDYHSRNLMHLDEGGPGVLDFQDAVQGPVTYDLVSLLRDCYVAWPEERVRQWALDFLGLPGVAGLAGDPGPGQWLRWFDLMGIQRHLKASGIFARLWLRDGKPGYLADIPRTLSYIVAAADHHPEARALGELVRDRVLPAMQAAVPAGGAS